MVLPHGSSRYTHSMPDQPRQPDTVAPAQPASASIPSDPAANAQPAKHSLTYALDSQQVKKRARRRKQFYIAGLLALIISGFWWAPATYRRINYQISLYQCRKYEFPQGLVVVDKSNPKAPFYGPFVNSINGLNPPSPNSIPLTTVYLHQRNDRTSSGLVVISAAPMSLSMTPQAQAEHPVVLIGSVAEQDPPSYLRSGGGEAVVLDEDVVKIFAGQTDPKDPSHFTIDYMVNDQLKTIDGYLRHGQIILEPRTIYDWSPVPADASSAPAQ